jgi:hypothetical protein
VVTPRSWRQDGERVGLPAAVLAAGVVPVARCVVPRGGRLVARPSFFQFDNLR